MRDLKQDLELTEQVRYKYLHFEFLGVEEKEGKYTVWVCKNNKNPDVWLGFVVWYERWKQYCFEPIGSKIFSADCLADVKDFVDRVNWEHKEGRGER